MLASGRLLARGAVLNQILARIVEGVDHGASGYCAYFSSSKSSCVESRRGESDNELPVVVIATRDEKDPESMTRYEKTVSNIQEVKAREGIVLAITTKGDRQAREASDHTVELPMAPDIFSPMLEVIPLQLLAYHIAVRRGCDVDQPRNLAKSVTVE